jgi:hypothetical protein
MKKAMRMDYKSSQKKARLMQEELIKTFFESA